MVTQKKEHRIGIVLTQECNDRVRALSDTKGIKMTALIESILLADDDVIETAYEQGVVRRAAIKPDQRGLRSAAVKLASQFDPDKLDELMAIAAQHGLLKAQPAAE